MRDEFSRSPNSTEEHFFNLPETRRALHAGHRAYNDGKTIAAHMRPELARSARSTMESLLTNDSLSSGILYLTDQQDMNFPHHVFEEFFSSLRWPGAAEYYNAKRCQFRIKDRVVGYYKTARHFTQVMIRGAGHIIYGMQPKSTYLLIDAFIRNSSIFQCT
ncbi:probable serine carboxypeptidase CPVL [Bemisia tabaci]|uniref:probable serine carboxypeptidase CPVL n=1 Tax=Bemisia tabaci TaxID=7038 RepID=UPI003B2889EE